MSSGATTSLPLPGRDGGMGGQAPAIARPGRPPTEFACAHFPPAIGSPVRAIRPSTGPAPFVSLPSLSAIGGTGLQGLSLLDF